MGMGMVIISFSFVDLNLLVRRPIRQAEDDFRIWHKADMAPGVSDVSTWVKSRHP
jgi:hypothetical protein